MLRVKLPARLANHDVINVKVVFFLEEYCQMTSFRVVVSGLNTSVSCVGRSPDCPFSGIPIMVSSSSVTLLHEGMAVGAIVGADVGAANRQERS